MQQQQQKFRVLAATVNESANSDESDEGMADGVGRGAGWAATTLHMKVERIE